ncbi:hypothetical protein PC128_g10616 [Phytophthora cactorum]|nr:hypothetical protein PC120_g24727 [Phytophthora cactorum]KAG3192200.1 hypothetical protein PC128_g10616 [Phytophthora cactorum]KAG4052964.1 hypothetical protein PC123_g11886 [Phytophthora cactorum]
MLSSGGSRKPVVVMRRIQGEVKPVPAPELVSGYHRWMGGVDVHDQLRMQRYSVQLAFKTRKYYRTLFLGLFHMAAVNAFIVYRYFRKVNNMRPPRHFAFFETLMEQLLAVDQEEAYTVIEQSTTARERTAASPVRDGPAQQASVAESSAHVHRDHRIEENPDTVDGEQDVKSRKLTKCFCPECSNGSRRKYLATLGVTAEIYIFSYLAPGEEKWKRDPTAARAQATRETASVAAREEAETPYASRWWQR